MTNYNYKARDRTGALTEGAMEAEDSRSVAQQLQKQGYTPVAITASKASPIAPQMTAWRNFIQRVSIQDLIVFTRQLASILEAGVSLTEGLDAVAEQLKSSNFKMVIIRVRKDVEGGTTFSDALEKHKNVFTPFMVTMIRVGEKAGILDEVLDRVSNLLEKDKETADNIKTATRYPMIVVGALVIAFVILTIFVIPRFANFFGAFKTELPLPTRMLMGFNDLILKYWYVVLGLVFIAAFASKKILDTEKGRYSWDKFVLSTPIFGQLFSRIYLSRFCRMLAAMIRSGIPILEALVITSATVQNKVISRAIMNIRDDVERGENLIQPMKKSNIFPSIAISMVAIGEKSGNLESMLNKVADYFDQEADYTIKNLTPLLEPILIFGLGLVLLFFALGIFLPMWDLVRVYQSF